MSLTIEVASLTAPRILRQRPQVIIITLVPLMVRLAPVGPVSLSQYGHFATGFSFLSEVPSIITSKTF